MSLAVGEPATLAEALRQVAHHKPEELAFATVSGDATSIERAATFAQLHEQASQVAATLLERTHVGDRVLICLPTGLDFVSAYFGCLLAGMVAVPIIPPSSQRHRARVTAVAESARASVALIDSSSGSILEANEEGSALPRDVRVIGFEEIVSAGSVELPDVDPAALAMLQYTSGSTGHPKGVMLSHSALVSNCIALAEAIDHGASHRFVSWLPLFHDMGLIANVLLAVLSGAPVYYMTPAEFIAKPERWVKAISSFGGTTSFAPNFAYDLCVRKIPDSTVETLDLSTWRAAVNGAEPVRKSTIDHFVAKFAPAGFKARSLLPAYGMAERCVYVSGGPRISGPNTRVLDRLALSEGRLIDVPAGGPGSTVVVGCGRPVGATVVAVDTEGRAVADGEVGELWIHGSGIGDGYWGSPSETSETFGRRLIGESAAHPEHGWLASGDLGFVHEGEVYPTGRIKDLIIKDGRNIYPQDIEVLVSSADGRFRQGCTAASAFGQDGAIAVFQEVNAVPTDDELVSIAASLTRSMVDMYGAPLEYLVLLDKGWVSKTSSGKVARNEMTRRWEAGELNVLGTWKRGQQPKGRAGSRGNGVHLREIRPIAASILACDPDDIDADEPLSLLGLESQSAVELAGRLSEMMGRELAVDVIYDHPTLRELAAALTEQR